MSVEAVLMQQARAAQERIAQIHLEVACPKCHARVGQRCRRAPRGGVEMSTTFAQRKELKHPHEERWTLRVPKR